MFLLLTTAPPDCTQLPDASFPKPTGTYRCFLVSQRPSALQSSLSFSHLGSWHVQKGVAGVCIPLFEFPFGFNFMFAYPSGCWSSEKLHPQWLFDFMFWGPCGCFRFKTLPWSCLPHTGNSFLKNLLIYPVNASKRTHSHLYFPYWNSNSQMLRLVLERLKSVNMSEQTLVIAHCLLLQFHSVCQSTLFISRCLFCELFS